MTTTITKIETGTHGNTGFFYLYDQNDEQIAVFGNHQQGVQLHAVYKNGRNYKCTRVYKDIEDMCKKENWMLV